MLGCGTYEGKPWLCVGMLVVSGRTCEVCPPFCNDATCCCGHTAETPRPDKLLKKLMLLSGDGELNMAAGDDSLLRAGFEAGDASLEPLVFKPFIDWASDFCVGTLWCPLCLLTRGLLGVALVENSADARVDCAVFAGGLGLVEALSKSKTWDISKDEGSIESRNILKLVSLWWAASSIFHDAGWPSAIITSPEVWLVLGEDSLLRGEDEDDMDPLCEGRW